MKWYKLTQKYVGVPHKLGSWNLQEGIDCLALLILFRQDMGEDVSGYLNSTKGFDYKGKFISKESYMKELKDFDEMVDALKSFIRTTYKKTNTKVKGCVCFYKIKDIEAIGIYLGQGLMLSSFETYGCKVIKIRNNPIMEIYK